VPLARTTLVLWVAGATLLCADRSWAYTPAVDYALHCQGCHLEDGRETPGRVPALVSLARFARLPMGRAYLVRVPGVAQSPLDDAALAALLNWVLVRFSPGGPPRDLLPYTAEEVGRLRRMPLNDVAGERRRLLEESSRAETP
jgi:hypothetical protein